MVLSRRQQLQVLLEATVGPLVKVHFQPTSNLTLEYPCVVYELDTMVTTHADNRPYTVRDRYQVTTITQNVDSDLRHKIAALPMTAHSRHFQSGYLNHDVFNLYF